jgi:hypothetical protein
MMNIRLPVSGLEVNLQQPGGAEDVLLLEATACDTHLALALLASIVRGANGSIVVWEALPVTDLDVLLLRLRQMVYGDLIRADALCPAEGCGAKIEVVFRIGQYLAYHQPQTPRGVKPAAEAGWFQFQDMAISFRLPNIGDWIAVAHQPKPERKLAQRCIQPSNILTRQLKRVERAMEALAPNLCNTLQGTCPECGMTVDIYFDPQQFTLQELRDQAAFIYEDVHLLASHYQWSEAEILALPRHRRYHYAERVRQERRPA